MSAASLTTLDAKLAPPRRVIPNREFDRSTDWIYQELADANAWRDFRDVLAELTITLRLTEARANRILTELILSDRADSAPAKALQELLTVLQNARDAVKQVAITDK